MKQKREWVNGRRYRDMEQLQELFTPSAILAIGVV
jgi:hypothetical protein